MIFVYFSYALDQKLIEQSIRSLRRVYRDPKIFVFWQAGQEGFLEGVENLNTDFDRKGNLNGVECCQGIIDSMIFTQGEKVVKIDSDIILTKPIEEYNGFWFLEATDGFRGCGACYSIDREVLFLCREKLKDYKAIPNAKYPEDSTIHALCQNVSKGVLKLWNAGEYIAGYKYNQDWQGLSEKQVIHFGNADASCDPRIKKARDAAHMKLFLDYLDSRV